MAYRNVCEIANQLDAAIAWLRNRGIRVPETGRFSEYQDILNQACRARMAGRENRRIAPPPDTHDLFTALCEASDLWQISRLPEEQIEQNVNFVQRLVTGTASYTRAATQDQGRDSQFQLMTASLFARSGGIVELENPADVTAIVGCWPVAIECKRPTTIPALRRRIEDAYDQFRKHEERGLNAVRIIAIELSALVNPEFDVLVAQSNAHAANHIDNYIHELLGRAQEELNRAARNSEGKARIDGFLFRVLCVVGQPNGGNERVGEFWRVVQLRPPASQAGKVLDEVVRKLPGFEQC